MPTETLPLAISPMLNWVIGSLPATMLPARIEPPAASSETDCPAVIAPVDSVPPASPSTRPAAVIAPVVSDVPASSETSPP